MKENPLERDIEKRVCQYARSKNVLAYKFVSPSQSHVPDRLFIFNGYVFFIEFKRAGCIPTPAQLLEHEKMRAKGAVVHVVDSVEAGKRVIDLEMM